MKKLLIWAAVLAGMILIIFGVHKARERNTRIEAMRTESHRREYIACAELLTSDLAGLLSIRYQIPQDAAKRMAIAYVTKDGVNYLVDFLGNRLVDADTYSMVVRIAKDNNVNFGTAAAFLHDLDAWLSVRDVVYYQYGIKTD